MRKHAIITGGAGFIGSHLVDRLLAEGGWNVTVVDNFDPLYPRVLKEANLARHKHDPAFRLEEGDILDGTTVESVLQRIGQNPVVLVHLAARVGVRQSLLDPLGYHRTNVTGTLNLLDLARKYRVMRFVLASSSSVYGEHPAIPWKEELEDLHPISPYAVSKWTAEAFARVYARLHGLDTAVLRFFTVYGPRQRPDLAIHSFFRKICEGQPIRQFGDGSTSRDYTYVDDIVNGVRAAMEAPLGRPPGQGAYEVFNLGNSTTVPLQELIAAIEQEAGRKAIIEQCPAQAGDVRQTFANVEKAGQFLGFAPKTRLADGLHKFAQWYQDLVPVAGRLTLP
ncbi:MAG: GDP-mannose 4,6-dehydratase [Bacteroidetes bacterium]|nr:GDP-mannose 4,6-dehydratase [Bacteroidota bacterium]